MGTRLCIDELLAIFGKTEIEQERYFPEFSRPVWVEYGGQQAETREARFVALVVLTSLAKMSEVSKDQEFGELCSEIASLSRLLIEATANYEWLVWHPRRVRSDEDEASCVIWDIYGVWSVVRRLCRQALGRIRNEIVLRPFGEVFADVIAPQ